MSVKKLVLRCVRDFDANARPVVVDELPADDPQLRKVADMAAWHRVDPFAWLCVEASPFVGTIGGLQLKSAYQLGVARHLRAISDLATVSAALNAGGVRFAAFKGPLLSELVYPRPDLRTYTDLDLMVAPCQFRDAVDVLLSTGCELVDGKWGRLATLEAGEIHLRASAGTVIDLHWHLVNDVRMRRVFDIRTEDVLGRATMASVRGVETTALDPVDRLVHLCLHAGLAGADRLCWLEDIRQAFTIRPDWDAFIARSREWRAHAAVAAALSRAVRVLGAEIPVDVPAALMPGRSWRALARTVDAVAPLAPLRQHSSLGRIVARATRPGIVASWWALTTKAASWVFKGGPVGARREDRERRAEIEVAADSVEPLEPYLEFVGTKCGGRGPQEGQP